jgi:hypothetical protein
MAVVILVPILILLASFVGLLYLQTFQNQFIGNLAFYIIFLILYTLLFAVIAASTQPYIVAISIGVTMFVLLVLIFYSCNFLCYL